MTDILVNTGSGNGLLPDGTKPTPQTILIYYANSVLWHSFQGNAQDINLHIMFEIYTFEITGSNEVTKIFPESER